MVPSEKVKTFSTQIMNTKSSVQAETIGSKLIEFVEFEKRRSNQAPSKNDLMKDLLYGIYYVQQKYINEGHFSRTLDNNIYYNILNYIASKDKNNDYYDINKLIKLYKSGDKSGFLLILEKGCLNGNYAWVVNLSYTPPHMVDGREWLRGPKDENGYYKAAPGTMKGDIDSVKNFLNKLFK